MADYIWQLHCQTENLYHDGDTFPALKTTTDVAPASVCPVNAPDTVDMLPKIIRIDGSTLSPTSEVDLNEGTFVVPRATSFPASPAEGQVCYRSDLDEFYAYNGATWDVVGKGTPHANLSTISADDHHARDHAAAHSDSGADEITVENLGTAATDTALVLKPDGTGGLVFGAVAGNVNTVTTTDATVTTIATIAIPDNTVVLIKVDVTGRRTDAADRAGYMRNAVVFREAAGAATIQGTIDSPLTRESSAPWDATISVSGNNAIITVKGAAANTINWKSTHTTQEIA